MNEYTCRGSNSTILPPFSVEVNSLKKRICNSFRLRVDPISKTYLIQRSLNRNSCKLVYTGCKRVRQFMPPAETVRHIWIPPRLSVISCFLPRLLCSVNSFLQRLESLGRKQKSHGQSLQEAIFVDIRFDRKQEITEQI